MTKSKKNNSSKAKTSKTNSKFMKSLHKLNSSIHNIIHKNFKLSIAIIVIVCFLGVVLGSLIGLTVSSKEQSYSGNLNCNGQILSENFITTGSDDAIVVDYRAIIEKGTVTFILMDKDGNRVIEFNDWENGFRQKSVRLNDYDFSYWTLAMNCDAASLEYELNIHVQNFDDLNLE